MVTWPGPRLLTRITGVSPMVSRTLSKRRPRPVVVRMDVSVMICLPLPCWWQSYAVWRGSKRIVLSTGHLTCQFVTFVPKCRLFRDSIAARSRMADSTHAAGRLKKEQRKNIVCHAVSPHPLRLVPPAGGRAPHAPFGRGGAVCRGGRGWATSGAGRAVRQRRGGGAGARPAAARGAGALPRSAHRPAGTRRRGRLPARAGALGGPVLAVGGQ